MTPCFISSFLSDSLYATSASVTPMICAARIAAFCAPSIATVATGMPEGICTVASRASRPSRVEDLTGMPMTGSVVCAASTPARCAALPAAAMIAAKPWSRADAANSHASAGVRCALMTWTSTPMPNPLRVSIAPLTTGRSLSLPIMTATFLSANFDTSLSISDFVFCK